MCRTRRTLPGVPAPGWPSKGPSPTGPIWVCRKMVTANWSVWVCRNGGPSTGQFWVCRNLYMCRKRRPAPGLPPLGPLSTGQIAHHQLAKFECRKIYHNFPSNRRKRRFESLENGARRPRCPSSPPVCDQRPQRQLASWECVENARPAPRPVPRTGECPRRRDSGPVRPGRPPPPPSARRCRGP